MSHPMSESTAPKTKRSRRWLWAGIALVVVLLVIGGAVGVFWFQVNALDRELQAVIAELDENDPQWRLEEIEAQREQIPDEENGALIALSAYQKLPRGNWPKIFDELRDLPPPYLLSNEQMKTLRQELNQRQAGIEEARRLKDYPRGRHEIRWQLNPMDTVFESIDCCRSIIPLLMLDAKRLCQDEKMEEGWQTCWAILNTGKSIGDMPAIPAQWFRKSIRQIAVEIMERVLAQGQIKNQSLEDLQNALEQEITEPILLYGFRGERAVNHQLWTNVTNGTIPISQLDGKGPPSFWEDDIGYWRSLGYFKYEHIWSLKVGTIAVEAAKKPTASEQIEAMKELSELGMKWEKEAGKRKRVPMFTFGDFARWIKTAESALRSETQLHCAICGLAAERYRLEHQRWPENLGALVDVGLLTKVPIDPYDGKPLRYHQTKNGIIIYSIGQGKDNKGESLDNPDLAEPPFRIEFRLWNPDRRRQPGRAK